MRTTGAAACQGSPASTAQKDVAMTMQTDAAVRPTRARAARATTQARRDVASIAVQLDALRVMSVAELHNEYRRLFGEPSHSRNKDYLRKKLAWRIQEIAEGGISTRARDRIEALLDTNIRVRFRAKEERAAEPAPAVAALGALAPERKARDPRLPAPGTVLRKEHGGAVHEVTVLDDSGFEYQGKRFTSLSTLAKVISGSTWNGFAFFDLSARKRKGS
jgi:hypothetical protein